VKYHFKELFISRLGDDCWIASLVVQTIFLEEEMKNIKHNVDLFL
jgi:hypothetical protein